MKTLNLKTQISNKKDLHELVRVVLKASRVVDVKTMKDKHKMVTHVTTGALNNLCKELKLPITFDYSKAKPEVVIKVVVPNDFTTEEESEEVVKEEKAPEVKTTGANGDDNSEDSDDPF